MTTRVWEFGCPDCEGPAVRTIYRGTDEDGWPVRLYQCKACQHRWGTEERIIDVDAFWARFHSGNLKSRWSRRKRTFPCKVCPGAYLGGSYAIHKESPEHRNKLKNPAAAEKARRRYRRRAA